ncbi:MULTISPECIES: S8 family peptidase [Hymenobacter]|uniref:S8 family serine peptidase n=2 Tax=Hymenobacter TaxID=89966 RepID=A0ABS6X072_9BACT|nr:MULTISPECIES: S8 family serine peptidase [Hymenobacter]MBO3269864.1 S8 family serine peptidase [Hymenobacter defluvii]MBW3129247.1 S8 family serine peptidase [Hymenobacter profundi]QNE40740.1 S8 family serine peptidase [Hymenobacter sp. NBH84]
MYTKPLTHKILPLFSLGLLFTFGCAKEDLSPTEDFSATTAQQATQDGPTVTLDSKRYIIIASGDQLPSDITARAESANGTITSLLSEAGIAVATSDDPQFAAKASQITGVRSVVRDFTYQAFDPQKERSADVAANNVNPPSTGDSNPYFPLQWGHTAIQAPQAWNTGAQGEGVVVADLDSGFDLTHPDLQSNIVGSVSFVPGEDAQFRGAGSSHGTHTAGTIAAADNNIGVIGVAPKSKLLLVKVLRDSGSGSFSWMMSGIVYAVQNNAKVINLSLGAAILRNGKFLNNNGTPNDPSDDFIEHDAKGTQELLVAISKVTSYAAKQGVTIIASAGNDANDGNKDQSLVHIPADATGVISISATGPMGWALNPLTTNLDRLASYSNYGTSAIDFAAPGGDFAYPGSEIVVFRGVRQYVWALDMVLSTAKNGGYTWMAGTSMAAPHATGVAALIIGKNGGQMDPARVKAVLRASADDLGKPGRDAAYGHGRVNAFRAVSQAL